MRSIASRLRPFRIVATVRYFLHLRRDSVRRRRREGLRIAVDATPLWGSVTGIGWYLHSLLEGLADREDVCLFLYGPMGEPPSVLPPTGPGLELVAFDVPEDLTLPPGMLRRVLRYLVPWFIAREAPDVVFAPNFFPPRRFSLVRAPLVVTTHDLASVHFSWTLEEATAQALEKELKARLSSAARVVTPSATVREEILEAGLASPEKVVAVHHGPGHLRFASSLDAEQSADFRESLGLGRSFALGVGTLEPRKNLEVLLSAWRLGFERGETLPQLVLCGARGWKDADLRAACEAGLRAGWLVLPGYVDDDQLQWLYREAKLVVQASLYEGFGLPLVEAMLAGRPLVCSDIPVFREVAQDAALFVPAEAPESWLAAVLKVVDSSEGSALAARAKVRAGEFDWRRCADETLAVLQAAAAS
ncbi:MAG: glycosyltransferase family 1 protein [Acidobacteriota bacterium]